MALKRVIYQTESWDWIFMCFIQLELLHLLHISIPTNHMLSVWNSLIKRRQYGNCFQGLTSWMLGWYEHDAWNCFVTKLECTQWCCLWAECCRKPGAIRHQDISSHGIQNGASICSDDGWLLTAAKAYLTSMALCKTAVSPLLTYYKYCSLPLSHRYRGTFTNINGYFVIVSQCFRDKYNRSPK